MTDLRSLFSTPPLQAGFMRKLVRPEEIEKKIKETRLLEWAQKKFGQTSKWFPNPRRKSKKKLKAGLRKKGNPKAKILGDSFYFSREWKSLRYTAIKKYGRKCMACFRTGVSLHVDHIKPRSKYPDLALVFSNLQVLCEDCNLGKGNKDSIDWRPNK